MTGLDWIIVALVALLALYGFAQGFIVGALTLAGFVGGALLGSRLAPGLLDEGARSPYAPVLALAGAVLGGALLSAGLQSLGHRVRRAVRIPGLGVVDGLLGALLSGLVGLALAWVVGAVVLQSPVAAGLRRDVQRSVILGAVNDVLPPRTVLNALARFDPLPALAGPAIPVGEPPSRAAIVRDPQIRAAAASVVRVTGTACGLGVGGSGWVAGDGLVVTNAHVVAGQDDTRVQVAGRGPLLETVPAVFDARDDVAVLRVPGLRAPALALAGEPEAGTPGAILGFPRSGPYDLRPARLGPTAPVRARDAYGARPVRRRITGLRGLVRSGNSGGPVVDRRGRVLTTVFAAAEGAGRRSGYGVPNDVVRAALGRAGGRADTGPCTR
jgi:S1-C subfamily serine protease